VPTLALTFDDGPDATWTPRVLDALGEAGASATFFVIAPRAERHPALIARMLREGHAVGLHCDEHVRHSERDEAWTVRDTTAALERLAAVGVRPSLWRTPYGDRAPWTDRVAARAGLRLVDWDVDTLDWRGDSAEEMLARIAPELYPGAVVLAHDGLGPGALRTGCAETVKLIRLLATGRPDRAAGSRAGPAPPAGRRTRSRAR
jgi:peptidoglycan/xylan/chitin deacetylase (PgdA/CDA1 family)